MATSVFRPLMVAGSGALGWLLHDKYETLDGLTGAITGDRKDSKGASEGLTLLALQQMLQNSNREHVTVIQAPGGGNGSLLIKVGLGAGVVVYVGYKTGLISLPFSSWLCVSRQRFQNAVSTLSTALQMLSTRLSALRNETIESFGRVNEDVAAVHDSVNRVEGGVGELNEKTNRLEAGVNRSKRGIELLVHFVSSSMEGSPGASPQVIDELRSFASESGLSLPEATRRPQLAASSPHNITPLVRRPVQDAPSSTHQSSPPTSSTGAGLLASAATSASGFTRWITGKDTSHTSTVPAQSAPQAADITPQPSGESSLPDDIQAQLNSLRQSS